MFPSIIITVVVVVANVVDVVSNVITVVVVVANVVEVVS
jgi:hypothetical protein